MMVIRSVLTELFGLFVDDGSFAINILVWLLVLGLGLPHLGLAALWQGVLLVGGLACILLESVLRRARAR